MLLFLDFDGVMHPTGPTCLPFEHLDALETILRRHQHVDVVISSSWRKVHTLAHMREGYFSADIQARVVGTTPIIPNATRWQEIMAFLTETQHIGPYLVIDDNAAEFPEGWEPLLLCAPESGLDAEKQSELVTRLQRYSPSI